MYGTILHLIRFQSLPKLFPLVPITYLQPQSSPSTSEGNLGTFPVRQSSTSTTSGSIGPVPIEDHIIAIPSNGNASNTHRDSEMAHHIAFAKEQLNIIRNLIAEKSFQFSHVIRVSPRKSITTRSRAAIRKLNNEIAERCRMYSKCRASLFILGADNAILSRLKVLTPSDVTASTAILKPNEPGSTRIKLSWIWQSSSRHLPGSNVDFDIDANLHTEDPSNVLECGPTLFFGIFFFRNLISFYRHRSACSLATCSSPAYEVAGRGNINNI